MNTEVLKQIQDVLRTTESSLKEIEQDIQDARRAGLEQVARDGDLKLSKARAELSRLKSVYMVK